MEAFRNGAYQYIRLVDENIDTDQIIPARFLTTTTRSDLSDKLFRDWRFSKDGAMVPTHPLNAQQGINALVTGANFGCGSSREHAAWALYAYGIRVIIAESFADIFKSNALKNGILPITLPAHALAQLVQEDGAIDVDLKSQTLVHRSGSFTFDVDPFARELLLAGGDELDYLLRHQDAIARFEQKRATAGPLTPIDLRNVT